MHEFCSHCDVRKASLFEINQQLGERIENLKAENENLISQIYCKKGYHISLNSKYCPHCGAKMDGKE